MNCLNEAKERMPEMSIPEYCKYYTQEYVEKFSNGCGDKWTAWVVPETILGMSIKLSCICHDLEYQYIIDYLNSIPLKSMSNGELGAVLKSMKTRADLRFKHNIEVLADYEFLKDKEGTFSFLFWQSETKQAKRKKNIRYAIADHAHYELVQAFGTNAIESKLKKGGKL